MIKALIACLAFIFACFLPASALTPTAPENRVWEKITGTLETHQEAAPQVPQSHQEEAGATAETVSECFLAAEGGVKLTQEGINAVSSHLWATDPNTGMEIHEIQPVKFGGSPTDISNKIPLPTSVHRSEVTPWWNDMQRSIEGGN